MERIKLGIDNLEQGMNLFEGKRVGLITNPTGLDGKLNSTIDILREKVNLVRLYSPEHGVRGDIQAGVAVSDYTDERSGLPVTTLYGKSKRPTREMLEDIDLLAIDIQDVGSRLYTYLYTMSYCMQGCAQYGKSFVVFDRPNPLGGEMVEGNLIKDGYTSFVGLHPMPHRYGLTMGETARFFNEEFQIHCDLQVIPMEGWKRDMYYEDTGLLWIPPSPNMPSVDTAFVYNGTCIFEGTNISEGRGTAKPFEFVGAPWLDADRLADRMNGLKLEGAVYRPVYFTPCFSKHEKELCRGVQLHVTDRKAFRPVKNGLHLLEQIKGMSGGKFRYLDAYTPSGKPMIDYNTGSDYIRTHDFKAEEVYAEWSEEAAGFSSRKELYHLYQ
ncbi:uncharacterized protein YbbC (DUF1343 family) [Anaerotaenia torta]|uniref:exo-beta-N-acetylmuramidase NamZ family protein n=1 Tax=Anaerotaenia torta TaxID=433293 RepID=UPI003D25A4A6